MSKRNAIRYNRYEDIPLFLDALDVVYVLNMPRNTVYNMFYADDFPTIIIGGKNPETGASVKERRFRLKDNYSRFYLKYIEPVKMTIDDGRYEFMSLETLENWDAVMGLQFENMVVNNYGVLIPYLHLQNVLLTSVAPYRKLAVPSLRQSGCQIDLLIQSRRTSYIVEIKRKNEIGRDIIEEVDAKVRSLKTRPNVSVRTALVYDGHLAPIVEADGYFDAIVPFHKLLGLC